MKIQTSAIFKIGEAVTWTSQARSHSKKKEGTIVQIVSPGALPNREAFLDLYKGAGVGIHRNHFSYVIQVGKKHYWPRVIHLNNVPSHVREQQMEQSR